MLAPWKKSYDKPRQHIKKQRHHFANKVSYSQSYGVFQWFMYGCESWTIKKAKKWLKNWCFWTVVLEKTFESPLDCKEIQPVHPKGNWPWIFIGRTDAEAEAPIIWPSDVKRWFVGEDPDAGKDWRQQEKGQTEDEMVGWHHWLNRHEFDQSLGDSIMIEKSMLQSMGSQSWTRLSDWTATITKS